MRFLSACLALAILTAPARAGGEDPLTGNWKVNILEEGQNHLYWILKLDNKDKLTGSVVSLGRVPPSTLDNLRLQGDLALFQIRVGKQITFSFEAKLPRPGAKKMYGSMARGGNSVPIVFESTTANNQFELDREVVAKTPSDPRVFDITRSLIGEAKAQMATAEDVKKWVDIALKSSESYGPRYQGEYSLKLLDALSKDWADVSLDLAKSIEAGFDAKTPLATRLNLLGVLEAGYRKTGQTAQAKNVSVQIDKLESEAYADYMKEEPFKAGKFAGRKGKNQRAVLVELFTGAQCPPCVAADLAFDSLSKAYSPSEVVLLQYHLHIPGPDALTSPDSEIRQEFYGSLVQGTPAVLFNGRPGAPGGGGRDDAEEKFKEFQEVINPLLEKPDVVQLSLSAVRKGDKIDIKATATDLQTPGDKVRMRLALVEDWARYKGRNGLTYHHRVVRSMPGGIKGVSLPKKDGTMNETVDLVELQNELNKYLDAFHKEEPFPDSQRPMRLRDLHVVAFVQNDMTGEILGAIDTKVRGE